MLTLPKVNAALAAAGYAEQLERYRTGASFYFAWYDGDSSRFYSTIVDGAISSLRQCDMEFLLTDLLQKRTEAGL